MEAGRPRASRALAALVGVAFAILALLPLLGLPLSVWLGALGLIPGAGAVRVALMHPESTARLIPAQARTTLAFLLYAVGSGIGLLLSP